jgi:hypothetical protein
MGAVIGVLGMCETEPKHAVSSSALSNAMHFRARCKRDKDKSDIDLNQAHESNSHFVLFSSKTAPI